MTLIHAKLLVRYADEKKCLKCTNISSNNELYCDLCGPSRSTVELTDAHKDTIKSVVRVIREAKTQIEQNEIVSLRVKKWLAGLISKSQESLEIVLHTYIYIFWSSLQFPGSNSSPNLKESGNIYFTSESLPYSEKKPEDKLISSFKQKIGKDSLIDLVSIDSFAQTIVLIEIKRGKLDDRTVGQLLRYYEHWYQLLHHRECYDLNINYIKIRLIVDDIKREDWKCLPQFFRDIVDIYRYKISSDGSTLSLDNARRSLLSGY